MAGHSKWANIRRRKASQDALKAKRATKHIWEIIVAARQGADPEQNTRLRFAMQQAKAANIPKAKILQAVKKANSTDSDGLVAVSYEGCAPHGVALLIEGLTNNVNRTVAHVRMLLSKHGGSLGKRGALQHLFDRKGVLMVSLPSIDPEALMLHLIEQGVEDFHREGNQLWMTTAPAHLEGVKTWMAEAQLLPEEATIKHIPHTVVTLDQSKRSQVSSLIQAIEALDDIQQVHHNLADPDQASS